ncbi:MAG: hypothetical protein IPL19_20485 [Sandaracinaceae bacterium]|nr:hypothetical protein [Sandaracinaceae bacterium]
MVLDEFDQAWNGILLEHLEDSLQVVERMETPLLSRQASEPPEDDVCQLPGHVRVRRQRGEVQHLEGAHHGVSTNERFPTVVPDRVAPPTEEPLVQVNHPRQAITKVLACCVEGSLRTACLPASETSAITQRRSSDVVARREEHVPVAGAQSWSKSLIEDEPHHQVERNQVGEPHVTQFLEDASEIPHRLVEVPKEAEHRGIQL